MIEVRAFGLLIRPGGIDAGISLGYRHAVYLFPRSEEDGKPGTEWRWFRSFLGGEPARVRGSTSLGLELQFTPEIKRLAFGYVDQFLIDGGPPGESSLVNLRYVRGQPADTMLSISHPK